MSNIAAAIITIGDELLIGQTIDTNSAWIAQHLNDLGIDVLRRVAVGDSRDAIINALDDELANASLVIITGGLGPTADDITKPLLCEYFGGKLRLDEPTLEHVKSLFAKRNRPFIERNMKQAEVPDNCTVLFNKMGTAPGMWFDKDNKVIISLPGVPFEMINIMKHEVLPKLRQRFFSDALLHRSIITAGEGESFIAEKIKDLEEALPSHIKLAYLPAVGMVKLRLTGRGSDKQRLSNELQLRMEEIANRLEDIVIALEDVSMELILGKWFTVHDKTLALAESCTGGAIASQMTGILGSSKYFSGCIVSYNNDIKHQMLGVSKDTLDKEGAVSEQTAIEMVKGVRKALGSDYALAVTGLLSPGGESDRVEVGTVWIAVADNTTIKTKKFQFVYDRIRNKDIAISMAMLMIWKFINGKPS